MSEREKVAGEFAMRDMPVGARVDMKMTWRRVRSGGTTLKAVYFEKFADGWYQNVGKDKWVVGRYSDAQVAWQLDLARSEGRA